MAKSKKHNNTDPIIWYSENKIIFEQLSKKVESILREIISDNSIAIHGIYSRAKEIESFKEKIEDPKYTDPTTQITDLAGIRIISYVESDLEKISKFVEDNFSIDSNNSIDKTQSLGTDKVGYRSIHYVAKLSNDRLKLPEYKKFLNLSFEIQIRTILQHAWAEIEHDKDYKFSGELPSHIKRRFKVLSGVLELADREFNLLASEIDSYEIEINEDTQSGNLDIEINSTSLEIYMREKFSEMYKNNKISQNDTKRVISELKNFNIINIKDLDNIISDDLVKKISNKKNRTTIVGILRLIMIITDIKKYFSNWQRQWASIRVDTYDFLKEEQVPIDNFLEKYSIKKLNK